MQGKPVEARMVILTPKWLSSDILGYLLACRCTSQSRPMSGCFSLDMLQVMFPETDIKNVLLLLEALDVCSPCTTDGKTYGFPCLNFVTTPSIQDEMHNAVHGGIRFECPADMKKQLVHVFPHIQVQLQMKVTTAPNSDLYQWYHGSKYCSGSMEALVTVEQNDQVIEVKCRGPPDHRTDLCYFLEELCELIEGVFGDHCPGISVLRNPLSVVQLRDHTKDVYAYNHREVLNARIGNITSLMCSTGQSEELIDLLAFGSQDVMDSWGLGLDLPIEKLSLAARCKLSQLLDPDHQLGLDWRILTVALGMQSLLEEWEGLETSHSVTAHLLKFWSRRPENLKKVRTLIETLNKMDRSDASDALLDTIPCTLIPPKEKLIHELHLA